MPSKYIAMKLRDREGAELMASPRYDPETRLAERLTAATERAWEAERRLHAVRTLKVWVNEDGKRFVFADELFEATDPDLAERFRELSIEKEQD